MEAASEAAAAGRAGRAAAAGAAPGAPLEMVQAFLEATTAFKLERARQLADEILELEPDNAMIRMYRELLEEAKGKGLEEAGGWDALGSKESAAVAAATAALLGETDDDAGAEGDDEDGEEGEGDEEEEDDDDDSSDEDEEEEDEYDGDMRGVEDGDDCARPKD